MAVISHPSIDGVRGESLRLVWSASLARWSSVWPTVASACRGRVPRVALPLDVEEPASIEPVLAAAGDVLRSGGGVDVVPFLRGAPSLTTVTAGRLHAGLVPALPRLPASVGVVLVCAPPLAALQSVLSMAAGSALTAGLRLGGVAAGAPSALWSARQGRRDLRELVRDLAARRLLVAVPPPLLPLDASWSTQALHWVLGCPDAEVVAELERAQTAALCLAPLVLADRASQHRALTLWAARHKETSDAIVLGPAGPLPGIGPAATYRSPAHLRQDLAAATALGFRDITIVGLDGLVLDEDGALRADAGWLEAALGDRSQTAPAIA